jgi:phage host-nuclease inhibitor protein Gam
MSDLRADLDEYVAGVEWPDEDDELPPPQDADQADRYLRTLRALQREAAEIHELYQGEIARITAWRADRMSGIESRAAHLTRLLEGYARATIPGRKAKTLSLPNGALKLKAAPAAGRVEIEDVELFRKWALENAPALLHDPKPAEPDKAAIKAQCKAGPVTHSDDDEAVHVAVREGEAVPGVKLVLQTRDSFSLSTS